MQFGDVRGGVARTVLEGVGDDDVGLVRFLQDGAVRRTEEHNKRLGAFDRWVLDVVHDGQTAGLDRHSEELVRPLEAAQFIPSRLCLLIYGASSFD